MAKVKEYVPIVEPKSTSYLEIVELSRTITPHPVFKKDTVFVRVKKICRGNPAETFETEEHWEYDVPWPVEEVKVTPVVKKTVKKSLVQKVKNIVPEPAWGKPKRARNAKGHYIKNDPNTPENEAWEGGVAPPKKTTTRKRKSKS